MVETNYNYTLEVMGRAVDAMAVGRAGLRVRLQSALISLVPLDAVDFPPFLQARFDAIMAQCTKNPSRPVVGFSNGRVQTKESGTIAATIPFMRWKRLDTVAREIVSIEAELRSFITENNDETVELN